MRISDWSSDVCSSDLPVLTPYLVGLLVLLGMLGTFLGMVATLRGTGLALEGSTDLAAIRASLAAPVQGLGFAFGTSVAGGDRRGGGEGKSVFVRVDLGGCWIVKKKIKHSDNQT